jgi:exopolysaccharide production protein ExoZ
MVSIIAMEAHKQDFYLIQALRFLAAFMVVCCHATLYTKERLLSSVESFKFGANGVPLFFVISGFVIVLSSRKLIKDKDGWRKYAIKRIIRIVPLYWLITTYKFAIMILPAGLVVQSNIDFASILKSYFFIPTLNIDGKIMPTLGVGWTLNFEMFFYLLFTIALFLRLNTIVFSGIIMIILTVLSFFKTPAWPIWLNFYADPIVINFLFGMISAVLIIPNFKVPKSLAITLILIGLIFLFSPLRDHLKFLHLNFTFANAFASFAIVYFCAQIEKHSLVHIPKIILFFGAASYSLYLIHPVIAPLSPVVLKKIGLIIPFLSVSFCIILALIAAAIAYLYYEKPVTKFLNKKLTPKPAEWS